MNRNILIIFSILVSFSIDAFSGKKSRKILIEKQRIQQFWFDVSVFNTSFREKEVKISQLERGMEKKEKKEKRKVTN